jgi:hypothetical protein
MRGKQTTSIETCINDVFRTPANRHRPLAVLCLLAAFSLRGTTPPPIEVAESLEWMTWDSDLIVLGYPHKVEPDVIPTNDSMFGEQVTIDVKRVLYGSYDADSLSFRWETNRARSMKREVDLGREPNVTYDRPQLFFLRWISKQQADGGRPVWDPERRLSSLIAGSFAPDYSFQAPQHFLNFLPLPQGHWSLRPTFGLLSAAMPR